MELLLLTRGDLQYCDDFIKTRLNFDVSHLKSTIEEIEAPTKCKLWHECVCLLSYNAKHIHKHTPTMHSPNTLTHQYQLTLGACTAMILVVCLFVYLSILCSPFKQIYNCGDHHLLYTAPKYIGAVVGNGRQVCWNKANYIHWGLVWGLKQGVCIL